MKKLISVIAAITLMCSVLMLTGCGSSFNSGSSSAESETAENTAFNEDNQAYWREMLQKYRKDDKVHQVMLVRCTEGSNAIVQFYNKLTNQKNAWTLVFETDAYI